MTRSLATALLFATLITPALADECRGPEGLEAPTTLAAAADGEFRYVPGKGLGCTVREEAALAMAANQQKLTYLGCLTIGKVAVSQSLDDVEDALGKPDRVMRLSERVESRAYLVPGAGPGRPHYAVTYRDGDVVAAQLIGPAPLEALTMSSLKLGDPQARVLELFGPPVKRCPGPRSSESWLWPPFPIGVDMADGMVVAMKVSWPSR